MQNVSQSDLDKVRTTWQTSEQSVSALNASIQNLLIQRGERDDKRNVTLQKYRNALEEAQLNLGWSKVYAETDGMVSNLQLNPACMPPPPRRCWRWSATIPISSLIFVRRACATPG
jgi:multidrug resistance efflux pump